MNAEQVNGRSILGEVNSAQRSRTAKRARVLKLLESNKLDGLLLTLQSNFAWYSGGARTHINVATEESLAELLITKTGEHLFINAVESRRMADEEMPWKPEQVHLNAWWEDTTRRKSLKKHYGNRIAIDTGTLRQEVARLRYSLLPDEIERYRLLGKDIAAVLWEVAHVLRPGMMEYDLAAELALRLVRKGIEPLVNLVAFDERVRAYRHPLPTENTLKKIALIAMSGRRSGLVASASRQIIMGTVSEDFRNKHRAVVRLDAWLMERTKPNASVADIFNGLKDQYTAAGYPNEWYLRHQGGATGYTAHDYRASETSKEVVQPNQAFAWNPTITGTKSEDTIVAGENGYEVLTFDQRWPSVDVEVNGTHVKRPDLLILD